MIFHCHTIVVWVLHNAMQCTLWLLQSIYRIAPKTSPIIPTIDASLHK